MPIIFQDHGFKFVLCPYPLLNHLIVQPALVHKTLKLQVNIPILRQSQYTFGHKFLSYSIFPISVHSMQTRVNTGICKPNLIYSSLACSFTEQNQLATQLPKILFGDLQWRKNIRDYFTTARAHWFHLLRKNILLEINRFLYQMNPGWIC